MLVIRLSAKAGIRGDYAGHSLRVGLATAAAAGVRERANVAQTGHRPLAMLRKYICEGTLFTGKSPDESGVVEVNRRMLCGQVRCQNNSATIRNPGATSVKASRYGFRPSY